MLPKSRSPAAGRAPAAGAMLLGTLEDTEPAGQQCERQPRPAVVTAAVSSGDQAASPSGGSGLVLF